jgi:hypothetical protein
VEHDARGADAQRAAAGLVDRVGALGVDAGDPHAGQHAGAVRRRGARDGDHEPRVVLELAVPGEQPAAQPVLGQRGRQAARLQRADAPGGRQERAPRACAGAHAVADPQAGHRGHRRRAARPGGERDHERQRADEVRRDVAHQDGALACGLPGQAPLAVGEVAQAAVDELGAPAARALGEVAALDQRDRQAPAGGVERDARAGDPATDDEHVDPLAVGERGQLLRAARGGEGRGAQGRR